MEFAPEGGRADDAAAVSAAPLARMIGRNAGIAMAPASSKARSALHAKGLDGAISAMGEDIDCGTKPRARR